MTWSSVRGSWSASIENGGSIRAPGSARTARLLPSRARRPGTSCGSICGQHHPGPGSCAQRWSIPPWPISPMHSMFEAIRSASGGIWHHSCVRNLSARAQPDEPENFSRLGFLCHAFSDSSPQVRGRFGGRADFGSSRFLAFNFILCIRSTSVATCWRSR